MKKTFAFLAVLAALSPLAALGQAFTPSLDGSVATVAVAASTTNATGSLGTVPSTGTFQVRVYNACTTTAFIDFDGVATTSNMPMPAGIVEVLTLAGGTSSVGVILASGSGCSVYFTVGRGL
jgi:hypothetical protein